MNIIKPKVTLLNSTISAVQVLTLTKNARLGLSQKNIFDVMKRNTAELEPDLKYIAQTNPGSWEFIDFIFVVEGVSRAYTHQQVRTRTASYAQESLRVVPKADIPYVLTDRNLSDPMVVEAIERCLETIKSTYQFIAERQSIEDARGILPTNTATSICIKMNLRTLADIARARTGGRTQGEYIAVVNGMIDAVLTYHPWAKPFLFGDKDRDYFAEIEQWAESKFGGDITGKAELLKIVDKMRKEA